MTLIDVYQELDAPRFLYELMEQRSREEEAYTNISHRKLPTVAEHLEHYQSKPYAHWYVLETRDRFIGSLSLTRQNEIGIVLKRNWRGAGYGSEALRLFLSTHEPLEAVPSYRQGRFLANINPKNGASIALFQKFGFDLIQHTYAKS